MNKLKRLGRRVLGFLSDPHLWLLVYMSMFVAFMPSAVTWLALVLQGLLLMLCFYKLYEIVERRRIGAELELTASIARQFVRRDRGE